VLVIAVGRALACIGYGVLTARLVALDARARRYDAATAWGLLGFGGWLTVTNILTPVIVSVERFVIANVASLAAVAYYAAPYEIITKLWIVSAAVLGALFPVLSALEQRDATLLQPVFARALTGLVAVTVPAVALLLAFAPELLDLWLGPEFAQRSTRVAQILALGMIASVMAQVPLTVLHATGRADITAKLLAAELPVYLLLLAWLTTTYGIEGAALGWLLRASADCALLFALCARVRPGSWRPADGRAVSRRAFVIGVLLAASGTITGILPAASLGKAAAFGLCFVVLIVWTWTQMLHHEHRQWLKGVLRSLIGGA
jgi:O-antigen/teichoic acid export membrane protein